MGLRFSYIVVIDNAFKTKLEDILCEFPSHSYNEGECLSITFGLDRELFSYLKEVIMHQNFRWWKWMFFRKADHPEYFPSRDAGSIGCIYYRTINHPDKQEMFCVFTAATNSMSRLFVCSDSVKKYFADLASSLEAKCCFIDLEDEGFIVVHGEEATAHQLKNMFDNFSDY